MVRVAHFLHAISFLLAASLAVHASATPKDDPTCPGSELCTRMGLSDIKLALGAHSSPDSVAPTKRLTNAERFARGLPPMKPRRLYTGCGL